MERKYPLLAEQFIKQEIKKRKSYYEDGLSEHDQTYLMRLEEDQERFERLMLTVDKLIIY